MGNPLDNASIFIISTFFDVLIFIFLARLILIYVQADFYNPLSQFINKTTQFIIPTIRRYIPNIGKLELASVFMLVILSIVKFLLIGLIITESINVLGLPVLASADILKTLINIFSYTILIQVVMSWMHAGYSPYSKLFHQITSPILAPLQRIIPAIAGIDITPMVALFALQLFNILCISPLWMLGQVLAFK
jgi:YggT family protein